MLVDKLKELKQQRRFGARKPIIENFVFKLHYLLTAIVLMACVVLVCAREYYGDYISCITDRSESLTQVIQKYCFFMATFTVVRHYNESMLQSGFLPHPGVGPLSHDDEILQHKYYQWVPFVLFLQSVCFYMPHYVWKKKEGGRIGALVNGLQNATMTLKNDDMNVSGQVVPSRTTLDHKISLIKKDIVLRLRVSKTWSTWLVSMELVNFLNIMFQIWLSNRFLNGRFLDLGPRALQLSRWNDIADPLETVFPKVTKCTFHKFGPSGSIQKHDALCVMALNIIHEKIYTMLWFWFLLVLIASTVAVIWRVASFFFYRRSMRLNQVVFRQMKERKMKPYHVIEVVNGCEFADWLFLHYLAVNMNEVVFTQLFESLAEELIKRDLATERMKNKFERPKFDKSVDFDDETLPLKQAKKSS